MGFARGEVGLWGLRLGRSMDLGGSGGGELSRHVVGTIGTVLLWTCRLLFVSSEFCRTSGGWSCTFWRAWRRFLRLWPVRLLRDLGRPERKPVLGVCRLAGLSSLVRARGVVGASYDEGGVREAKAKVTGFVVRVRLVWFCALLFGLSLAIGASKWDGNYVNWFVYGFLPLPDTYWCLFDFGKPFFFILLTFFDQKYQNKLYF